MTHCTVLTPAWNSCSIAGNATLNAVKSLAMTSTATPIATSPMIAPRLSRSSICVMVLACDGARTRESLRLPAWFWHRRRPRDLSCRQLPAAVLAHQHSSEIHQGGWRVADDSLRSSLADDHIRGDQVGSNGHIVKFRVGRKGGHQPGENGLNLRAPLNDVAPLVLQGGVFREQRGHAFRIPAVKGVRVSGLEFEDDGVNFALRRTEAGCAKVARANPAAANTAAGMKNGIYKGSTEDPGSADPQTTSDRCRCWDQFSTAIRCC